MSAKVAIKVRQEKSAVTSKLFAKDVKSEIPSAPVDERGVVIIGAAGDLVLSFEHEQTPRQTASFRVDSNSLRDQSPYFRLLLDPDRFEEGRRLAFASATLSDKALTDLPSDNLPSISIQDVGRISAVKSLTPLLTDFLLLLHSKDLTNPQPPLSNLANLAIVADRFDALPVLRTYVHSKRLLQLLDAKSPRTKSTTEEKLRQRCLLGVLLEHGPYLLASSQRLIQRSSFNPTDSTAAQWHDLPASLEEELSYRRSCLLSTIHSLQTHFLTLYASRNRQCKLGYDSSSACDSFQLGEMVRFFAKIGTLDFTSSGPLIVDETEGEEVYAGDLIELIDKFRQCPEYQIDTNHRHCGLRTRIMPLLDVVEKAVEEVGICGDCWRRWRGEYAWIEAKRPLCWSREGGGLGGVGMNPEQACLRRHMAVREMCMAEERIWEKPRDGLDGSVEGEYRGWTLSRKR